MTPQEIRDAKKRLGPQGIAQRFFEHARIVFERAMEARSVNRVNVDVSWVYDLFYGSDDDAQLQEVLNECGLPETELADMFRAPEGPEPAAPMTAAEMIEAGNRLTRGVLRRRFFAACQTILNEQIAAEDEDGLSIRIEALEKLLFVLGEVRDIELRAKHTGLSGEELRALFAPPA